MQSLLRVEGLKYTVDGHEILRGMNVHVPHATVHAVVGPNGAGKSTLAYAIMGLSTHTPSEGSLYFEENEISAYAVNERARLGISLAWQEPARFEGITVRDFLGVGAVRKDEEFLRSTLEQVALDPDQYLDRAVDAKLSGGERKRIEVASIVAMEPKLMILDEPDSGIDVEALHAIFDLLSSLRECGTAVMLVTHSQEVLAQADTATLMCCGKNVDEGESRKISEYFQTRCIPCELHNPDMVEL